jgi:hypothetical protein
MITKEDLEKLNAIRDSTQYSKLDKLIKQLEIAPDVSDNIGIRSRYCFRILQDPD